MSEIRERFGRIEKMTGPEGLEKLRESSVAIIGLGAVGGFALEALVRSGIGKIVLADFDIVRESNFNRQILAVEETLGMKKSEAARERVLSINPGCRITVFPVFVHEETMDLVFGDSPDYVIDAIDSMNPKITLLTWLWNRNIPTVSSMGAARKSDPSLIKVGDMMDTKMCPLARQVRKGLKNRGVGRGITAVYSTEPAVPVSFTEEELKAYTDEEYERGRPRHPMGSFPAVTGIFGLTAAQVIINRILSF